MYEEIKVGTVIELSKKEEVQLIFVGYINSYVMLFYEYSPDMLRSFVKEREWILCIGLEINFPYTVKKQLDEKRLMAWYLKNQMRYKLPQLSWKMESMKQVRRIKLEELEVFDIFLNEINLYVYLGKTFNNEYICYKIGTVEDRETEIVDENNIQVLDLESLICEDDLYYIRHSSNKFESELRKLHYGDYL